LNPTDIGRPDYFHKVVDCQWACPAHTPVPEYIRLIAAGHYSEAYLINWRSNVFPGILGRTCDRPCEPACRRARVEEQPVAICRLKRVAADYKDDIVDRLPKPAKQKNARRIACIGAGPASLTVARDLLPLGYHVVIYEADPYAGGMIRTQIPRFRLPEMVIDEEIGYILNLEPELRVGERVTSMRELLAEGYDAIFVGCGAPRGRDLQLPGRTEAAANIHIGIDWLSSVSFGHVERIGKRVIVLGGGNTAMDCCRSSKRLGGEDVRRRPAPHVNLMSQKMGIHEWSYDNDISTEKRNRVPLKDIKITLKDIKVEVELGFDPKAAFAEAQRCLNCDVQTVFADKLCIECDACVDICPMDCINFTDNGEERQLRARLRAPAKNTTQDLYVSGTLKTGRIMVKDEDLCLHCGLCAERCPTGAWDMQKFFLDMTHAGPACRSKHKEPTIS